MGVHRAPDPCGGTGTQLCSAWIEPAKPQDTGRAAQPWGAPGCYQGLAAAGSPSPWGLQSVQIEVTPSARKGCCPIAGWAVVFLERVRQSPEADQCCLKGAGSVVCPRVRKALSLPQPGVAFASGLGGQKAGET